MRRILILVLIITLSTITGCWDQRPVDELSIISNIAIEKSNSSEKIQFSVIRPTFEKDKKEFTHKTTVEATSIIEAMNEVQKRGSKTYVLGQVNNVLLGKELASAGINDILSQLDHINDFKTHSFLAILDNTISDLEQFEPPQQERTGILLLDTIQASIEEQQIPETKFHQIMSIMLLEGREIVLPVIKMSESDHNVIVESLGIFKDDKMVGTIGIFEAIPYMIITSPDVYAVVVNIPSEETKHYGIENLSVVIRKKKMKIETSIKEDIPIIHADIALSVDIHSYSPSKSADIEQGITFMDKESVIKKIENSIATYLENETKKLVERTQDEFESDIFGFGEKVRVQNIEYFKNIDWMEEYPNAIITCSYKVTLGKLGTVK